MYVVPDAGTNLDNGSIVQSIFGSSVLLFSRFRKRKTAHEGTSIHTIDKIQEHKNAAEVFDQYVVIYSTSYAKSYSLSTAE